MQTCSCGESFATDEEYGMHLAFSDCLGASSTNDEYDPFEDDEDG